MMTTRTADQEAFNLSQRKKYITWVMQGAREDVEAKAAGRITFPDFEVYNEEGHLVPYVPQPSVGLMGGFSNEDRKELSAMLFDKIEQDKDDTFFLLVNTDKKFEQTGPYPRIGPMVGTSRRWNFRNDSDDNDLPF